MTTHTDAELNAPTVRGWAFTFTSADGSSCRVVVDRLRLQGRADFAQGQSNALAAVISTKGTDWVKSWSVCPFA